MNELLEMTTYSYEANDDIKEFTILANEVTIVHACSNCRARKALATKNEAAALFDARQ